ncbi:uncharacterized protein [Antedon mediterranea]|uniref:uncharacterized protein n=1 Tax=Antedon mediterranea TaxID=105859 RepID=UPI003AF953E5
MSFNHDNIYDFLIDECNNNTCINEITINKNSEDIASINSVNPDPMLNYVPPNKINHKHVKVRRGKKKSKSCNTNTNIKIAYNNIRGYKSKKYDIQKFVNINKINLFGIVESFLKDKEEIQIKGYNWIGKNRSSYTKKSQGGIGFLIRDDIKIIDDNVLDTRCDTLERLWVKVQFNSSTNSIYYIALVYFPCEGTDRNLTDEMFVSLLAENLEISQNDNDAKIIILGDFNGKIGHLINDGDESINYNGQGLIDFSNDGDLFILNGSEKCTGVFTWVKNQHKSVLDYGLVSANIQKDINEFMIDDQCNFHIGSDHNMIIIDMNVESFNNNNTIPETFKQRWDIKYNHDWTTFQEDLESKFTNWDPAHLNANEAWESWKRLVVSAAEETIGYKKQSRKSKQWFDCDIEQSMEKRKKACRAHRIYCKNKTNSDFNKTIRDNLWKDYQTKRNECKTLIRQKMMQIRMDRCSKIMEKGGPQSRDFWSVLKGNKRTNNVTSIIIPGTDNVTSDAPIIKSSLTNYFNTLGKKNLDVENDLFNDNLADSYNMNFQTATLDKLEFSCEDVKYAVSLCKNNKSPGNDNISNELIKNGGNTIVATLYKLFKRLSHLECIPDEWNNGTIVPIFKKGDRRNLDNYRGITLNSCIAKIYSRIISRRISEFLEEYDLLTEAQGGFRKDRQCEDHIFTLKSLIATRQAEGKKSFLAFLDFRKAFDTVWREGLIKALRRIGIKSNLINIVQNLYENVKCKVQFANLETELFDIDEGVKQGCSLSPTLFSIYINELRIMLNNSDLGVNIFNTKINCLLWADDVVLIGENEKELKMLLQTTTEFAKEWKMSFNYDKSNVLITRQRTNLYRKWRLGNNSITETDKYKYLGVYISRTLSDNLHIDEVIKKGNRIIA